MYLQKLFVNGETNEAIFSNTLSLVCGDTAKDLIRAIHNP